MKIYLALTVTICIGIPLGLLIFSKIGKFSQRNKIIYTSIFTTVTASFFAFSLYVLADPPIYVPICGYSIPRSLEDPYALRMKELIKCLKGEGISLRQDMDADGIFPGRVYSVEESKYSHARMTLLKSVQINGYDWLNIGEAK